mmetsp:Transcript_28736/g.96829  ORF Transcript_28736/g.96829 Transcript_28736/m.96829 type:complete len:103 (+) Transcript_28736:355-663(+)
MRPLDGPAWLGGGGAAAGAAVGRGMISERGSKPGAARGARDARTATRGAACFGAVCGAVCVAGFRQFPSGARLGTYTSETPVQTSGRASVGPDFARAAASPP